MSRIASIYVGLRIRLPQSGIYACMHGFAEKITRFQWLDLDEKHGSLRVWEDDDEHARLVLFTEDETGKTYVLIDQSTTEGD